MAWYEDFDQLISQRFPRMERQCEEPMAAHTTIRIGGPARRLVRPASQGEMIALLELAEERDWPWMILGNGSNLLTADKGVDLLVIRTDRLNGMERTGEKTIRAECGIVLGRLARFAQRESLQGLEFAHGIPGSLGGAVTMNAGAYGGEMCQVVRRVRAWFPGEGVQELTPRELSFGYRHSVFSQRKGVVLEAEMELSPGNPEEIGARIEELMQRRREKQPLDMPSAGSTFKRPENGYAAAMIDRCGLKGMRIGGAQVSEKHAGFVINAGGATCGDVLALIEAIQAAVYKETGVELEPEVKVVC